MAGRGGGGVRKDRRPIALLVGLLVTTAVLLLLGHATGVLQPKDYGETMEREGGMNSPHAVNDYGRLEEGLDVNVENGMGPSGEEVTSRQGRKGEEW